jgi:acyl-CoA reductase-like NAD-dependent aldehyde dehydrogenase
LTECDNLIAARTVDTRRKRESIMEFESAMANLQRCIDRARALLADSATRNSVVPPMTLTAASVPIGLVAVISLWNFPMLLALIDTVPALAAGCAVDVKPSESMPRFVEPLQRTIAPVPAIASVLHFVAGDANTGAAMIDVTNPARFTGSFATGRVIARKV